MNAYVIWCGLFVLTTLGCSSRPTENLQEDVTYQKCDLDSAYRQRQFETVIACCNHRLAVDSNDIDALEYLALSYYLLGKHDLELLALNKLIALCPCPNKGHKNFEYSNYLIKRSAIKGQQGQLEEAFKDIDLAISMDSSSAIKAQGFIAKAIVLSYTQDKTRAVMYLDSALIYDNSSHYAYWLRSVAKRVAGAYDEALTDADNAIRLEPKEAMYYSAKGDILFEKLDFDGAIESYTAAKNLKPSDALYHYKLALVHNRIGKNLTACEFYRKSVDLGGKKDAFLDDLCKIFK